MNLPIGSCPHPYYIICSILEEQVFAIKSIVVINSIYNKREKEDTNTNTNTDQIRYDMDKR